MKCEAHNPVAYIGGPFPKCICEGETAEALPTTENFSITTWEAKYGELTVTVSYKFLGMAKKFVWKDHTTNHYGQGSKWCWWYWSEHSDPSVEVHYGEGQDILTCLVRNHDPLKNLADHYKLPVVCRVGDGK